MKYVVIVASVLIIVFSGILVSAQLYKSSNNRQNTIPSITNETSTAQNTAEQYTVSEDDIITDQISPTGQTSEEKGTTMKQYTQAPSMTIDTNKSYIVRVETTKGPMTVKLFAKEAPSAVNNFLFLANEGYYTDTPFHRIINGFMIQGGDPTGTGTGGPGYRFNDEPITREYLRGTLAMANAGPNTNGSQFFVMHKDYPLPKNYVIFGQIDPTDTESLKTLDAIAETQVTVSSSGEMSKPSEEVRIVRVTVED
jgi:cyclophilin family peptidyl-prolyl cis-trans isomerase